MFVSKKNPSGVICCCVFCLFVLVHCADDMWHSLWPPENNTGILQYFI